LANTFNGCLGLRRGCCRSFDLVGQLAQLPSASQKTTIALSFFAAAGNASGWAHDLAIQGDQRRTPAPINHSASSGQILDHYRAVEGKLDSRADRRVKTYELAGQANDTRTLGNVCRASGTQRIEGQEGRAASLVSFEKLHGSFGIIPAAHDDVLYAASKRGVQRSLVFWGNLYKLAKGPQNPAQFMARAGVSFGLALALPRLLFARTTSARRRNHCTYAPAQAGPFVVQTFEQIELVLQPRNHALCSVQAFLGLAFRVLGECEGLPLKLPFVVDRDKTAGQRLRFCVQGNQLGLELCQLVLCSLGPGCLLTVTACQFGAPVANLGKMRTSFGDLGPDVEHAVLRLCENSRLCSTLAFTSLELALRLIYKAGLCRMFALGLGELRPCSLQSLVAVVQGGPQIGDLPLQIVCLLAPEPDLFAPDGQLALYSLRLPV